MEIEPLKNRCWRVEAVANVLSRTKKWDLTQEAFDKMLGCLDADRERAGETYEQMRSSLVRFFQWRGCRFSEDHADETINRVARKLGQGEEFRDIYTYTHGVARMVVMEVSKAAGREQSLADNLQPAQPVLEDDGDLQARAECLRPCLEGLPLESREMIMKYYQGERGAKIDNRQKLAEAFSVSPHVLRNRAYRLREKLQDCVDRCMKKM